MLTEGKTLSHVRDTTSNVKPMLPPPPPLPSNLTPRIDLQKDLLEIQQLLHLAVTKKQSTTYILEAMGRINSIMLADRTT